MHGNIFFIYPVPAVPVARARGIAQLRRHVPCPTSYSVTGTILLARHATTADVGRRLSGRAPIPLSPDGLAEAKRLAERLANVPLAAIHTSPLARAAQTAQAVAAQTGAPVIQATALNEIDFGGWTGRTFAELAGDPEWDRWNRTRAAAQPPGGETMAAAAARAVAHIQGIRADGPVLCVTHCDIIRAVVARYLGMPMNNLLRFDCDPASLTTIVLVPGGARVVALNERAA